MHLIIPTYSIPYPLTKHNFIFPLYGFLWPVIFEFPTLKYKTSNFTHALFCLLAKSALTTLFQGDRPRINWINIIPFIIPFFLIIIIIPPVLLSLIILFKVHYSLIMTVVIRINYYCDYNYNRFLPISLSSSSFP